MQPNVHFGALLVHVIQSCSWSRISHFEADTCSSFILEMVGASQHCSEVGAQLSLSLRYH